MQGVLRTIAMERDLQMRPGSLIGKGTKKTNTGVKDWVAVVTSPNDY